MAKLKAAVYVQDPATREEVILLPGESPDPEVAALVTNLAAWDVPSGATAPAEGSAAVVEPGPTEGRSGPEPKRKQEGEGADGGTPKKPPQRRSRSSVAA